MKNPAPIQDEMKSLGALRAWMLSNVSPLVPTELESPLGEVLRYLDLLSTEKASSRGLARHFLRAIGVLPKSEKTKKCGLGKQPEDLRGRLVQVSKHSLRLLFSRKKTGDENGANQEQTMQLADAVGEEKGKIEAAKLAEAMASDTPEGGEEFMSQEEHDALLAQAMGEQGAADPACVFSPESEVLFAQESEGYIHAKVETRTLSDDELASLKASPTDAVSIVTRTHTRVGFQLVVEQTDVEVQTAFSRESGKSLRADTSDLGPAKSRVSWDGLVSLMSLMVGYLVPANRIALLLGAVGDYFTAARCVKHLQYVAERLLPVHFAHARALATARLLQTDDTPARCPELTRAFEAKAADDSFVLPWKGWKHRESLGTKKPDECAPIAEKIAYELGFENENKGGGVRKKFNTTVVVGKANETDLRSFIVLYHSHLGQAGDLIASLLRERRRRAFNGAQKNTPRKKETIFLVSDLLSTNAPTDASLAADFDVIRGGCMHHARRNFVQAAPDDYVNCTEIQWMFDAIAGFEKSLSETGRREKNVLAVRKEFTGQIWEVIRLKSEALAVRWPKGTPVGKAARYVINHFAALTRHTVHAHMPDNNTLSERMLRAEKIMERSSLFRWSLAGRASWNVVRGIHQTCSLAGVNFRDYLLFVLKSDPTDVARDPERFLPQNFSDTRKI